MKTGIINLKIFLSIFSITFLINLARSLVAQEYTDGIVAIVDDEVITAYDVATFNSEIEKKIHRKYSRHQLNDDEVRQSLLNEINSIRVAAANELINQKLIHAEFVKKGYQLPQGLVDNRMDSIVSTQAQGDWEKFEEMLIASNSTLEELRERIEKNLIVDLFINQSIDKNINISPEQVEEYYQENLASFSDPRKIRLQVIAFDPKGKNAGLVPSSLENNVLTLLRDGFDFTDLVRKYSNHTSKEKDGDLGWIEESSMRQEFRDALNEVRVNEISEPITIDEGRYILRISDIQETKTQSLEEIYDKIKNDLFLKEKEDRFEKYIDELRNKSYVRMFFK